MPIVASLDERFPWLNRIANRLAHQLTAAAIASAIAQIPVMLTHHASPAWHLPAELLFLFALAWLTVTWLANGYHHQALCTICPEQVPLDIAEVARRRRPWLWIAHSALFSLASFTALGFLFWLDTRPDDWLSYTGHAVFYLLLAIEAYAMQQHRLLQPCCPWCDWDEGGEHEDVPEPTPPSNAPSPSPTQVTA
jgi:hypothetical protein